MGSHTRWSGAESNRIIGIVRTTMSFSLARPSLSGEQIESRPSPLGGKPALTRSALPDLEAANRKMTHLKSTEEEKILGGNLPGAVPGKQYRCRFVDGAGFKQKGSSIVRHERIKH